MVFDPYLKNEKTNEETQQETIKGLVCLACVLFVLALILEGFLPV